jgi:hypothetical protein
MDELHTSERIRGWRIRVGTAKPPTMIKQRKNTRYSRLQTSLLQAGLNFHSKLHIAHSTYLKLCVLQFDGLRRGAEILVPWIDILPYKLKLDPFTRSSLKINFRVLKRNICLEHVL